MFVEHAPVDIRRSQRFELELNIGVTYGLAINRQAAAEVDKSDILRQGAPLMPPKEGRWTQERASIFMTCSIQSDNS